MRSNSFIIGLSLAIVGFVGFLIYKNIFALRTLELKADAVENGVSISIANAIGKDKKICEKYQAVELEFHGEQGESLRILARCSMESISQQLKPFIIPFKHIIIYGRVG